jgi:hypothetical protein
VDVRGLFTGQPGSWNGVIDKLESDPASVVGIYVRAANAAGGLDDQGALQKEVGQDLKGDPGSRVSWDPDLREITVAGREARSFSGRLRPPGSTDSLLIRAVVLRLDATPRSVHLIFFAPGPPADPSTFEQTLGTFHSVLDSLALTT